MKALSQRSKYALRALQALARDDQKGPILISRMADENGLPRKFLEAILLDLKNHGLLSSRRGKGGGYLLRKRPQEITVGDVVRVFDGPLAPLPCASERAFRKCDDCEDIATCGTRMVMRKVRDEIARILDQTTVADLNAHADHAKDDLLKEVMYHI